MIHVFVMFVAKSSKVKLTQFNKPANLNNSRCLLLLCFSDSERNGSDSNNQVSDWYQCYLLSEYSIQKMNHIFTVFPSNRFSWWKSTLSPFHPHWVAATKWVDVCKWMWITECFKWVCTDLHIFKTGSEDN